MSMPADFGEELVGAYLTEVARCDFVAYNVRPSGGGVRGLDELDVIGLDHERKVAYLCEVVTHLHGYRFGGSTSAAVERVRRKHELQKHYSRRLHGFRPRYMFWSPRVAVGPLSEGLGRIQGLELVINEDYSQRIEELREEAGKDPRPTSNSAFRLLQILEHLREGGSFGAKGPRQIKE